MTKYMPGQTPYTPEELSALQRLVREAADGDPGEKGEIEMAMSAAEPVRDYLLEGMKIAAGETLMLGGADQIRAMAAEITQLRGLVKTKDDRLKIAGADAYLEACYGCHKYVPASELKGAELKRGNPEVGYTTDYPEVYCAACRDGGLGEYDDPRI